MVGQEGENPRTRVRMVRHRRHAVRRRMSMRPSVLDKRGLLSLDVIALQLGGLVQGLLQLLIVLQCPRIRAS